MSVIKLDCDKDGFCYDLSSRVELGVGIRKYESRDGNTRVCLSWKDSIGDEIFTEFAYCPWCGNRLPCVGPK